MRGVIKNVLRIAKHAGVEFIPPLLRWLCMTWVSPEGMQLMGGGGEGLGWADGTKRALLW